MTKRTRFLLFLLATGVAVAAAACGGGSSSVTGPQAPAAAAPSSSGATIDGTVQSGTAAAQVGASSMKGLRVSVTGTSLVAVTDGAGRFTLQGVPSGRVELRFEGTGVDARLTLDGLQDGKTLTVTVRLSGSSASVVDEHEDEVELKGKVDSVGASSLVVDGKTVHVDSATRLLDDKGNPIPLSGFKQGDVVEVEGTAQADGSVLATKVKLEGTEDDEGGDEQEAEFSGTISSLTSLVIAGRTVKTDANTKYLGEEHKTLTQAEVLKVGNKVEVDGVQEPDKSVLAKKIQLDSESED